MKKSVVFNKNVILFEIAFTCLLSAIIALPILQAKLIPLDTDIDSTVEKLDFKTYIDSCAKELEVPLEEFPQIDCTQGGQVQITSHGEIVPWDQNNFRSACDNPSMISNYNAACIPHSWAGTIKREDSDTEWAYLCRQFGKAAENHPKADVIGLIARNRKNGATCFFESKNSTEPIDAKNTPKLQDDLGKTFWKTPQEMVFARGADCVQCHSSGAFINTPFIGSITHGPEAYIPGNRTEDGKKSLPYWVVEREGLEALNKSVSWTPEKITSQKAKSCTGCHDIGNHHYCRGISAYAIGADPVGSWKPKGLIKNGFPHDNLHWNYYDSKLKEFDKEEDWRASRFFEAFLEIQRCCNSDDASCGWKKTLEKPGTSETQ